MDSLKTVVHMGVGFGGALALSKIAYSELIPALDTPVGRVASTFGVTVLESSLVGLFMGRSTAARVLAGGLLASLWRGLTEVLPADQGIIPTLGDSDEEFRRAVQEEVLREMRGGMGEQSIYLQPAGVEDVYIQPAGSEAYLTGNEGRELVDTGVGAFMTGRELDRAESGMGDTPEFGSRMMPERF